METILSIILGVLAVVFAFGFIIFIHELGHFLAARAVDIRCPQFAIGFGPSLFSFRWRGTNFAVRAFPLGGYVLMNGEEPADRTDDPWAAAVAHFLSEVPFPATPERLLAEMDKVPEAERGESWRDVHDQVAFARCEEFPDLASVEGNFHDRSVWARILVISGGVIMNFLAAILLSWFLVPLVGHGAFFAEWSPHVSEPVAGSPAERAGINGGDLLLEVDGKPVTSSLGAYHAIGEFRGVPLKIKFENRRKKQTEVTLTPDLRVGNETYGVGKDGKLTLKTTTPELSKYQGQVLAAPDRAALVALAEGKVEQKGATYEVQFEGSPQPVSFPLPESFTGPRGQIGVGFGVHDIRFEKSLGLTVSEVTPQSPAEKAGVKAGDILVAVDQLALVSQNGSVFYGSLAEPALQEVAKVDALDSYELYLLRGDELQSVSIPKSESAPSPAGLGIRLTPLSTGQLMKSPFYLIGQMLAMPYHIFEAWMSERATGKEIVQSMQGPIGIMQMLFDLADNGILQFIFFVALLNTAIGAFNLLPFPALDGSRLVFLFIAAIRGKALDPEKEAKIHLAGLFILLSFVILVSLGDVKRLFSSQVFVL